MASPYEIAATAIETVINVEFAPEQITATHDKLHESLGRFRVDVGIAPADQGDVVREDNGVIQETWIEVRFYDLWTDEIDPDTRVSPFKITGYADRLREALRAAKAGFVGSGEVWYFDVRRTTYPDDPTGNKTRFHMTIRVFGNNNALVETTT